MCGETNTKYLWNSQIYIFELIHNFKLYTHYSLYLKQNFNNKVTILKWPAQSPVLSPIENFWEIPSKQNEKFKNLEELFNAIVSAWNSILRGYIHNLLVSMKSRCLEVIKKGYATKYLHNVLPHIILIFFQIYIWYWMKSLI